LVAIAALLSVPGDPKNAFLLGLSLSRLALTGALTLGVLIAAALAYLAIHHRRWNQRFVHWLETWASRQWRYVLLLGLAALLAITGTYTAILSTKFTDVAILARLVRLTPLALWGAAIGVKTLIALPFFHPVQPPVHLEFRGRELLPFGVAGVALFAVAAFIAWTRLGLQPDLTGWDAPGTSLLPTQILGAWVTGVGFLGLVVLPITKCWGAAEKSPRRFSLILDVSLGLLIWALAIVLWNAQPLDPSYFAPTPRAPNYEYYPYSDAAGHDLAAQNLLIGEGYKGTVEKPLYALFLAGLHAIAGQDYLDVVNLQVVVLALFPVLLYLIGRTLHSRLAGVVIALLVTFREVNSIALSGKTPVSHAELLMTDLPAALGLALLGLVAVCWARSISNEGRRRVLSISLGGLLGIFLLLRSQALLLLPVFLLFLLVLLFKKKKALLESAILLVVSFALGILPWMFHNYTATGQFGYSQPQQAVYIEKQYSFTPGAPEQSAAQDSASSGFGKALDFALDNPSYVLSFISAHFLHNEASTLLALPPMFSLSDNIVSFVNLKPYWDSNADLWQFCCSLEPTVAGLPFWDEWDGVVPERSVFPILLNLAIIAVGIGATWREHKAAASVLLLIHFSYSLSVAIARVSGWRLILPTDWVGILFYAIGLIQVTIWIGSYFFKPSATSRWITAPVRADEDAVGESRFPTKAVSLTAAAILAVGLIVPLTGALIPAKYQAITKSQALAALEQVDLEAAEAFAASQWEQVDNSVVFSGRAFYPRYYPAGEGEPGGSWPAFNPQEFNRVGFFLVGPQNARVLLPLEEAPTTFPNASDVTVLGCQMENYILALAVVLTAENQDIVLLSNSTQFSCP